MASNRRLIAVDCETDPASHGRVLKPFLWGAYDGTEFKYWRTTEEFIGWIHNKNVVAYAHNGGKFDFMFLIKYVTKYSENGKVKAQVINGRIVKMYLGKAELRDSIAAVPEALKKFGKLEIDYAKMEANVREQHMPEILEYLERDCVALYELMHEYRNIAGKQITIAGNALKFSKKLGINMGRTNNTFDTKMRRFFYGGRCEVFKAGTHKDIRIIDIHSAYPFAMCHNHPNGSEFIHITSDEFENMSREEKQRCFIQLKCFAKGCFPFREKSGLTFPVRFDEYFISGWEYIAAIDLKLISKTEFIDIIMLPDIVNFTDYVIHWYDYKSRHDKKKNPIQYTIGKIMMNSLYGKAAQDIKRYYDYIIVDAGTPICSEFKPCGGGESCAHCGDKGENHGWELADEYQKIEIHRRSSLWKYQYKFGKGWEGHPLYNNVATGASITGFTRAHLLRALHGVGLNNVIYCDTDSIICHANASLNKLSLSEKLGDWADEGIGLIGHFAGKKLYGIKMADGSQKIASKGSKITFADIEAVMRGEIVQWKSEFPHFSIAGEASFVVRNIRQTAKGIPPLSIH